MHILVTGGFGFIGRHLLSRLSEEFDVKLFVLDRAKPSGDPRNLAENTHLEIIEGDLRNFDQVQQAVNHSRPDVIFHLAAVGVGDPFLAVDDALDHNLFGTLNLLRAAFENEFTVHGPQRIIISRTPGEYSAMNHYAASKAAAWQFCRMYAKTRGWPIVGAAVFQAYGPGQPDDRLLPAAINAALNGQNFPMTTGKQKRDWIYAADLISGLIAIRDSEIPPGTTIELGSGQLTSVAAIVLRIFDLIGGLGLPLIGALPTRPGEEKLQMADIDHTYKLTGWRTAVSLDEGLAATIDFLKKTS